MLSIEHKDKFINDGPFFEKYPDVFPDVTRYERTAMNGELVESWERGDDGRMHDVTQRDILQAKILAAEKELAKLEDEINE